MSRHGTFTFGTPGSSDDAPPPTTTTNSLPENLRQYFGSALHQAPVPSVLSTTDPSLHPELYRVPGAVVHVGPPSGEERHDLEAGTLPEPNWHGYVSNTLDALLLLEAAQQGIIPMLTRRLRGEERRRLVRSGAVFIFDETESGIKRWTDIGHWSPSRVLQNFLVYRQTEPKPFAAGSRGHSRGHGSLGSAPDVWSVVQQAQEVESAASTPVASVPLSQPISLTRRFTYTAGGSRSEWTSVTPSAGTSTARPRTATQQMSRRDTNRLTLTPIQREPSSTASGGMLRDAGLQAPPSQSIDPPSFARERRTFSLDSSMDTLPDRPGTSGSSTSRGSGSTRRPSRDARIQSSGTGRFLEGGLFKKTLCVKVKGHNIHLIAYYSLEDALSGRLPVPSALPEFQSLRISSELLDPSSFRAPPQTRIASDGKPTYVSETEVGFIPASLLTSEEQDYNQALASGGTLPSSQFPAIFGSRGADLAAPRRSSAASDVSTPIHQAPGFTVTTARHSGELLPTSTQSTPRPTTRSSSLADPQVQCVYGGPDSVASTPAGAASSGPAAVSLAARTRRRAARARTIANPERARRSEPHLPERPTHRRLEPYPSGLPNALNPTLTSSDTQPGFHRTEFGMRTVNAPFGGHVGLYGDLHHPDEQLAYPTLQPFAAPGGRGPQQSLTRMSSSLRQASSPTSNTTPLYPALQPFDRAFERSFDQLFNRSFFDRPFDQQSAPQVQLVSPVSQPAPAISPLATPMIGPMHHLAPQTQQPLLISQVTASPSGYLPSWRQFPQASLDLTPGLMPVPGPDQLLGHGTSQATIPGQIGAQASSSMPGPVSSEVPGQVQGHGSGQESSSVPSSTQATPMPTIPNLPPLPDGTEPGCTPH